MAEKRKNSKWYKIWKALFKVSMYYFAILIIGWVLNGVIDHLNDFLFPYFLLIIIMAPALLISFVALFIMRENDRERERIKEYNEQRSEGSQ